MMVPIQVIRWYRMQCYDGTDSCAIVVPIRRYCHLICTLGNQVLIRGNKLSSTKSLMKWSKKREHLKNLVQDLSLSHVIQWQNWNEDVIIKRNDLLGKKINEIWKK